MAASRTSSTGPQRPSLHEIGAVVADAVAARPGAVVTVACPGGAVELVVAEITRSLGAASGTTVRQVARNGRVATLEPPAEGRVLVVADAQWLADDELATVSEPGLDDGAVVLVHRRGPAAGISPRSLAVAALTARRNNAAFVVGPTTAAELRARGLGAAEAQRRLDLTGGRPDLLEAIELDGDLVQDVSARLSVIEPAARLAAELLAFGLDPQRLATALDASGGVTIAADDAIAALVAEGVLDPDDATATGDTAVSLAAGVATAVRAVTTGTRRAAVIDVLVRDDSGVDVLDLADRLDAIGDRSPAAGDAFRRAADRLAVLDPSRALHWIDRARGAGVAAHEFAVAEATAAVGAGDPHRALAVAGDDPSPDLALVRAAAWVAIGDLEAAAACLDVSHLHPLARWARVGAGAPLVPDTADAADAASDPVSDPAIDAAATLAAAVTTWLTGDREAVAEQVRRAIVRHRAAPDAASWPVTPDLAGALLHAGQGDLDRAERLLADALAEQRGGLAHRRRHLLAAAWLAASRGRLDDAAGVLDSLQSGTPLSPHESLWRAGVACAIAVRDPEPDSLAPAAFAALADVDRGGGHLYDLGVLTEIAAAAARTGAGRTDDLLQSAQRAIARLGDPPNLVADLAWARLRVALCCDDPATVTAAAQALTAVASSTAPRHRLRLAAAQALVHLDDGTVDAATIETVSRDLADAGAPHEAARLCGLAAVRTTNESDARRLLKHSRLFRAQRAQLKRAEHVDRSVVRLSEQETRVAQLVLEGRTHREIGATLFISAKTVEHHVAHIRTKLGAASRAEMLQAMRGYLDAVGASSPS